MNKLTQYFEPQKNRRYEVYRFRQATQEKQETLDQFHTRLRTMAQTCEFHDNDFEIEEQIIIGGTSSKIRKRALRDPNFDLKAMLLEGRRDEQSAFQAKDIESRERNFAETNKLSTQKSETSCFSCGGSYPHTGTCPAKGKECKLCKKQNHCTVEKNVLATNQEQLDDTIENLRPCILWIINLLKAIHHQRKIICILSTKQIQKALKLQSQSVTQSFK